MAHVATITIDHLKVASDLTDYVVAVVNNSDAGWAELYNVATAGGGDIRVYKSGGVTELPREIVSFSVSLETGEIHIKYTGTLSGSVDTDIEIHADGTSADYAVTATYGRNAVWSNHIYVSHDGGLTDSTGNLSPTAAGGVTAGGVTGKLGVATFYDGTDDNYNLSTNALLRPSTITIEAWVNQDAWTTTGFSGLFIQSDTTSPYGGYSLGTGRSATKQISMGRNKGGTWGGINSARTDTFLNTWHYLVGIVSSSGTELYDNGTLAASDAVSGTLSYANTAQPTYVNYNVGSDNTRIQGDLDEIRATSAVGTANSVSTNYENQNSPTTFYSVAAESTGNVTVTPATQVATFSLPAETVSTGNTVAANTQTATFSLPAETISTGRTITPTTQSATFTISPYSVIAPDTIFAATTQSATFSIPAETVSTGLLVQVSTLSSTFTIPASTASGDALITSTVLAAVFDIPTYTIDVEFNIVGSKITPSLSLQSERVKLKLK